MRIGVCILPELPWPEFRRRVRLLDELGVDHVWTYDHLAWRDLRDGPWLTAVPLLAAVATTTSRIRLGTLVASPNFRHPVVFAKELVALDRISDGRLIAGIGAGAVTGWDTHMLGQPPLTGRERADRFGEFVEVVSRLLRDGATSYDGDWYDVDEARALPGPVQRAPLPLAIAASGPRGMRLAADHGAHWITTGDLKVDGLLGPAASARLVADQVARLDEICAAAGRDPSTLGRMVSTGGQLTDGLESEQAFTDIVGRYADAGVTDVIVHWPRPTEPYRGDDSRLAEILTAVRK
ncbi:MAG TPA: LLM class flavin-dependent oxidoreductase [Mycobacteriales bacterium]|nr:LLM class flavin-dependent oxidoreductase [Mycobacteriales bacterium]